MILDFRIWTKRKNMANVWKIGSRWSPNGAWDSRIISIFRRSEVVFLGNDDVERY